MDIERALDFFSISTKLWNICDESFSSIPISIVGS